MNDTSKPVVTEFIPAQPVGEKHQKGFWRKTIRAISKLGQAGLQQLLTLYYAAQQPETPAWAKATVYGALGYFLLPIDSIPDFTPGVGFSDDLFVIGAAMTTIAAYVNDEVKLRAKHKTASSQSKLKKSN